MRFLSRLPRFNRRFWLGFNLALISLLVSILLGTITASSVYSVQIYDGVVFFTRPPILDQAELSSRIADVPNPNYRFKLILPENAGEGLRKVEFEQVDSAEIIRFDPRRIQATVKGGDRRQVTMTQSDGIWTATFEPPIEPGKTVTIALSAKRNPGVSGTYLIGVTAFPAGEKSHGQFLGFGRFRIQESRRDDR